VKLNVHEIEEAPKSLAYEEPTESLTALLRHGNVCDFEFPTAAAVRLEYYRSGQELFFSGHVAGRVIGHCARCLEEYPFALDADFSVVLVPRGAAAAAEHELARAELDLGVYEGDEVDLSPLVREQIIVALPTRPLCSESCRGLCPTCGTNRNLEPCRCAGSTGDPRLAALKNLRVGR
jgi:uncharacterized protein